MTFSDRNTIPILAADEVPRVSQRALKNARELLEAIEAIPVEDATVENVLDAWDDVAIVIEDAFGPISLLNSVHPDGAVRDACDVALLEESSFLTDAFQSERFYERVSRVAPKKIGRAHV